MQHNKHGENNLVVAEFTSAIAIHLCALRRREECEHSKRIQTTYLMFCPTIRKVGIPVLVIESWRSVDHRIPVGCVQRETTRDRFLSDDPEFTASLT